LKDIMFVDQYGYLSIYARYDYLARIAESISKVYGLKTIITDACIWVTKTPLCDSKDYESIKNYAESMVGDLDKYPKTEENKNAEGIKEIFIGEFGTVRKCVDCGSLIAGDAGRCGYCADREEDKRFRVQFL